MVWHGVSMHGYYFPLIFCQKHHSNLSTSRDVVHACCEATPPTDADFLDNWVVSFRIDTTNVGEFHCLLSTLKTLGRYYYFATFSPGFCNESISRIAVNKAIYLFKTLTQASLTFSIWNTLKIGKTNLKKLTSYVTR